MEKEKKLRVQLFYTSGEWAALYIDGKLHMVGDKYLSEERIFEMFGVEVEHDDSFMRGQFLKSGVAGTVAEIEEYRERKQAALREAREMREQANKLLADAARLEQQHRNG